MVHLAGCGGSRKVAAPEKQRELTALEKKYPALSWAPADASWVFVAARVSDGATALAEVTELGAIALGTTPQELVAPIAGGLGVSPLAPEELKRAGFALDRSTAVFAQAGFPTMILPIADEAALRALLDKRRPAQNAGVTQHRGHDVYSWSAGDWTLAWVLLDGWLLVRIQPDGAVDWLDEVLAAPNGGNLGGDPELERAVARGRAALGRDHDPGLVMLVRTDRLARDLAGWSAGPRGLAGCVERAAQLTPVLHGAAEVSWDAASGWLGADLGTHAEAVRAHLAPAAPSGFYAYRATAPIAFAWGVELPWLEKQRAALGCPFAAGRITDPFRAMTGMSGPRGIHGAASRVDPDDMSGTGAMHLILTDRELVNAQLERIPGRSLFERDRRIHGHGVTVLSVPSLPTILYVQEKDRFTIAFGTKVMEQVLAPGQDAQRPAGDELFMAALEPARVRNLGELLAMAGGALGRPRSAWRSLAERLQRYEKASLSLALEGETLALRLGMRLRK